ncbi:hypothetical protein DdX_15805 [Ditylenchus destructor]|uniref:Uncharacterized protein n=1 Tax=Ditylenchus destructor TaxID=166010 RepID=A0AAD4MS50_9BILA|nr:hypothetical protein DdX_15805 [Ditylenchus destructor]
MSGTGGFFSVASNGKSLENVKLTRNQRRDWCKTFNLNAISKVVSGNEDNHGELRALAVDFIMQHVDNESSPEWKWIDFWLPPYLSIPFSETRTPASDAGDTDKYGSTIHIIALCKLLDMEIIVYEPNSRSNTKFTIYTPSILLTPSIHDPQKEDLPTAFLLLKDNHYQIVKFEPLALGFGASLRDPYSSFHIFKRAAHIRMMNNANSYKVTFPNRTPHAARLLADWQHNPTTS